MTVVFKYKVVRRPDGSDVKAPCIPIVLAGKDKLGVTGLLDSGADISAMPLHVAEVLGLDLSGEKSPAFGVGGKVDAVETKVMVSVEKGHERYTFSMPVKVVLADFDFPILLGRAGFFEKFIISFDQHEERVSLKRMHRA